MAADLFLGVDIGTSGARAVATDAAGRIVARAAHDHTTAMPRPGWFEHDPDAVWWEGFRRLTAQILDVVGGSAAHRIGAVCVSGIGPTVLPADADGRPLRPAILYGVDTRAVADARELEDRLGAAEVLRRGGSRLSSQAAGPKLAWLAHHEPAVWRETRMVFMANSYLAWRLTGRYALDHHSASQADPLYDLDARSWADDRWGEIAGEVRKPPLLWPADVVGTVTAPAAAATGLAEGTPVAMGTVDAWAEAESVGVCDPGDLMVMYGSTMFFIAVTARPVRHDALWSTAAIRPDQHTLAAGMASSGSVTDWLRATTGGAPVATLLDAAADVPAGARGLLVLPYFAGERTPFADPDARGVIAGLTLSHGPAELYRAVLEGTGYAARHNLEAFGHAGADIRRVVAVGGGTRSRLWAQIVADITGRPQELPAVRIGAAYGDARLAATAVGAAGPDDRWNSVEAVVEPDARLRDRYDRLYETYHELRAGTESTQHRLAALGRP